MRGCSPRSRERHEQWGLASVIDPATVGDDADPEWGLHVMDIHLVEADLVRLVAARTRAWTARR